MNKMFKKSIAVLIAVLMIVTSLPFTAITAQAASSTQTINVTNGNYYGAMIQSKGTNRFTSPVITVVNDAQNDNFDIGFVTFDVSSLKGQKISVVDALYKYVLYNASWTENLGIKIYYPTKNYTEFHTSGSVSGSSTVWSGDSVSGSLVDHIGNAKSYFGLVELDSIDASEITTTETERTVDISESLQWSVDNNLDNAVICFMTAKQGGIGSASSLTDTSKNWTDTYIKITNTSLTADIYDSVYTSPSDIDTEIEAKINHGAYTANADRAADGSYTKSGLTGGDQMLSVLWTYGVGGNSNYAQRSNANYWAGGIQYGDVTFLYDGSTAMAVPVNMFHSSVSGGFSWQKYNMNAANYHPTSSEIRLDRLWHGASRTVGYQTSTSNSVNNDTSNTYMKGSANPATQKPGSINTTLTYYYSNTLYMNNASSMTFTDNLYTLSSTSWNVSALNEGKEDSNSKYHTTITKNSNIYVINYKPIKDAAQSIIDFYNNNVKGQENYYTPQSLSKYYQAINAVFFDPNSYFDTSSTSGNNYSGCQAAVTEAINSIDVAKGSGLVKRTVTVTYQRNDGTSETKTYTAGDTISYSDVSNSSSTYQDTTAQTEKHIETSYSWNVQDTTALNSITVTENSSTSDEYHSFADNGTCECGAKLDTQSYDSAVAFANQVNTDYFSGVYTDASYNAYTAIAKDCLNKIGEVHCQSELDAYTSKLLAAQTYLVKANVTIKFVKNVGGTETTISESTYSYGTEQTFDSGITDANITKWTVETEDGTSSMHTSLSSVKYVPYKDATIIVYADNSTSVINSYKVVFRGLNGSVQEVRYVESLENIGELPAGKNYSFYTFSSWGEPKTVGDTTYYDAVYTFAGQDSDKCGVHFAYKGGEVKQYEYDTYVKLSDTTEGKTYALSTSASESDIITYIKGNAFHTPHVENVYVIECDSADAKIGITGSYTTTSEKKNITVNVKYYIPDGAVRVDSGVDVVLVKGSTKSTSQRIKCPNVNNFNEFTKTLSTSNTAITAFEITPYVVYTLNGQQIEVKGSTQTYNL